MNIMTIDTLQAILEAAILVAGRPLPIAHMQKLFDEGKEPTVNDIKNALTTLAEKYQQSGGGIELKEVASGYQFQAKTEYSPWLSRLWEERAPRYSRAFLETLVLIAYRQPITRAEIEEVRGVTASSHIIKTLQEREWVRVLGYKEIPGKPALYGTTKTFLDYFNLKNLNELPTLAELKDLASQEAKLQLEIDFANEKTDSKGSSTSESDSNPDTTSGLIENHIKPDVSSDSIEDYSKANIESDSTEDYTGSNAVSDSSENDIESNAASDSFENDTESDNTSSPIEEHIKSNTESVDADPMLNPESTSADSFSDLSSVELESDTDHRGTSD